MPALLQTRDRAERRTEEPRPHIAIEEPGDEGDLHLHPLTSNAGNLSLPDHRYRLVARQCPSGRSQSCRIQLGGQGGHTEIRDGVNLRRRPSLRCHRLDPCNNAAGALYKQIGTIPAEIPKPTWPTSSTGLPADTSLPGSTGSWTMATIRTKSSHIAIDGDALLDWLGCQENGRFSCGPGLAQPVAATIPAVAEMALLPRPAVVW